MTATANGVEITVPDIGDFHDVPVIEVLVSRRRQGQRRRPGHHAGVRQGHDGRARPDRGHGHRGAGRRWATSVSEGTPDPATSPPARARSPRRRRWWSSRSPRAQPRAGGRRPWPRPPVAAPPAVSTPSDNRGAARGARRAVGAADGPRAGDRPGGGHGDRARRAASRRTTCCRSCRARPSPPPRRRRLPQGSGIPEIPAQDFASSARSRRASCRGSSGCRARSCTASWLNVPHVTQHDEADITALDAYRKELDTAAKAERDPYRVTLLAFLVKAAVAALKKFPEFNSSLAPEKDALILKGYYNIGIAVDTPGRPRRARREGRRPQGHRRAVPRVRRRSRPGPATASSAPGHAGRHVHDLQPRRDRRHRRSPRSSTPPRSRSSAWCARR